MKQSSAKVEPGMQSDQKQTVEVMAQYPEADSR
jgi:hypothetical protein